MPSIEQRAHRILRPLVRFSPSDKRDPNAIGTYQNDGASGIRFTNRGMSWEGNEVLYSQIEDARVCGEKTAAAELLLTLAEGRQVSIPVEGGHGRLRDVWEIQRFIDRVLQDLSG